MEILIAYRIIAVSECFFRLFLHGEIRYQIDKNEQHRADCSAQQQNRQRFPKRYLLARNIRLFLLDFLGFLRFCRLGGFFLLLFLLCRFLRFLCLFAAGLLFLVQILDDFLILVGNLEILVLRLFLLRQHLDDLAHQAAFLLPCLLFWTIGDIRNKGIYLIHIQFHNAGLCCLFLFHVPFHYPFRF